MLDQSLQMSQTFCRMGSKQYTFAIPDRPLMARNINPEVLYRVKLQTYHRKRYSFLSNTLAVMYRMFS